MFVEPDGNRPRMRLEISTACQTHVTSFPMSRDSGWMNLGSFNPVVQGLGALKDTRDRRV